MRTLNQTEQTISEEPLQNPEENSSLEDINAVLGELIKTNLPPSLEQE